MGLGIAELVPDPPVVYLGSYTRLGEKITCPIGEAPAQQTSPNSRGEPE